MDSDAPTSPDTPTSDEYSGIIEEIIFQNEHTGYVVCTIHGDEEFVAVGIMPGVQEGESVRVTGAWIEHPDYGPQLKVQSCQPVLPRQADAILRYLKSGIIKGIGPKMAVKLVKAFGDQTLDILTDNPERAAEIKGVGPNKARQIAQQLSEKQDYQQLALLLNVHGLGPGRTMTIYQRWGHDAVRRIQENPYCLADEIAGIGFETSDLIARSIGIQADSDRRVASAVRYLLKQILFQGNTFAPADMFFKTLSKLLGLPVDIHHPVILALLQNRDILLFDRTLDKPAKEVPDPSLIAIPPDPGLALRRVSLIEKRSIDRLYLLNRHEPARFPEWVNRAAAEKQIERSCRKMNLELAPEQKLALIKALQSTLLVLTGGPGTGKTTIIRVLCDCLNEQGGRVLLAAPTGRAAKRLSEATGCEAKTIHRLLALQIANEQDPVNEAYNMPEIEPLSCDLLVVDETSMLDLYLFKHVLDAVIPGTRVVFVGDADQLPSIGPGQVLRDLVNSPLLPQAVLSQIFRQAEKSLIVRNAHHIRLGQPLEVDQSLHSSFIAVYRDREQKIAEDAVNLCTKVLPDQYNLDPIQSVQVLSAVRKGSAGILNLNQLLQASFQSADFPAVPAHGTRFAVGDKVIQLRNQYDMTWISVRGGEKGTGVLNGETGIVRAIDLGANTVTVLFDEEREVVYDIPALDDLDLGYALTIHKSQGSEYPVVVLVLPYGYPEFLTRNLLYTAVTRARDKVFLLCQKQTLERLLRNERANQRQTRLPYYLELACLQDAAWVSGHHRQAGPDQQLELSIEDEKTAIELLIE